MKYQRTILSGSIVAALIFSGSALASSGQLKNESLKQTQTIAAGSQQTSARSTEKTKQEKPETTQSKPVELQAIQVVGIRRSQEHSIQLKRNAADIQDSITAENIGELPDVTIADSLQRVTGVQIDRSAGEGTTINVRGLPEVSTLINGEAFITPGNIYTIQPNYESLPSELFEGVDVIKSARANIATSGISGTINLRTRRPWDLPFGWTIAGTVKGSRGSSSKQTKPDANALISYNDHGKWGLLFAASYSNLVHSFGHSGFEEDSPGEIVGENSSSANASGGSGYLTGWSGTPPPPEIVRLPAGAVDVNGDGKSNGAFYIPPELEALNRTVQPKRLGLNMSFQANLGHGLTFVADGFYTHQLQLEYDAGLESLGPSQVGPTILPLASRDTGYVLTNPVNEPGVQQGNWHQNFYTTQVYNQWYGDVHPTTRDTRDVSIARNFNLDLNFDNGGAFTADLRFINATGSDRSNSINFESTSTNGSEWPNTLKPGVFLPPTVYMRPASKGGDYVFNPNGFSQFTFPVEISMQGKNPVISMPAPDASKLAKESTYRVKSNYAQGERAHTGMNIFRADGHYYFNNDFSVDFGARSSIRSANHDSYRFVVREYAGEGATDPLGCLIRYTTSDVVIDGGGVSGACTASNQSGYYRGNELTGPIKDLPSIISSNMERIVDPGETSGLDSWVLNPKVMKKPASFYTKLHPGAFTQPDPSTSWNVLLKERTIYGQANFKGSLAGHQFRGNVGLRIIRTNLGVTQFITGGARPYGLESKVEGRVNTDRQYTDILPAINLAINLTPKLMLRLSEAKNMMPLSLNEWGGGFSTNYSLTILSNGKSVRAITSADSGGNPDLKPWRSKNFGASLEYYLSSNSMVSLAWFRMNIASFIENSSVINCSLPDLDGVVRHRCVPVSEPVQGTGQVLQGEEFDYKQSLTFLPGFLSQTGFEVNATYSPSSTGKRDMAGNSVPFQDNSEKSGNLILWYENHNFQIRLAGNYRSKRAVSSNYAGIDGFELYQRPTFYVDASISYKVTPKVQIFAQGQNLTNERQQFYLVWPDQKIDSNISERYLTLGIRAQF